MERRCNEHEEVDPQKDHTTARIGQPDDGGLAGELRAVSPHRMPPCGEQCAGLRA